MGPQAPLDASSANTTPPWYPRLAPNYGGKNGPGTDGTHKYVAVLGTAYSTDENGCPEAMDLSQVRPLASALVLGPLQLTVGRDKALQTGEEG